MDNQRYLEESRAGRESGSRLNMANGLDYNARVGERGSQRGGSRKRGMGEMPKRRDQEPRKPEKPKVKMTGLYRNEKPGDGESMNWRSLR